LTYIEPEQQITPLLQRWQQGDSNALNELAPLVYHQLCLIARKHMRGERVSHSFSTADLVHEAYFKLFGNQDKQWANRVHFFALAGRAMRNILINHAAKRNTQKRGGEFEQAAVDLHNLAEIPHQTLGHLNQAITELEQRDHETALLVELRYFCGFTLEEMARALPYSSATIKRKLKFARVWLDRHLK